MITKAERAELRSVVRQQFKVLRAELEQRKAELLVDIEDQIRDRYAIEDARWGAAMHAVHEAVLACNRAINDALADHGFQTKSGHERLWIRNPGITQPTENRHTLRYEGTVRINAQVKAAALDLDRREADLLRSLSIGALESDEARRFLTSIPSVGDLVPATRLAELEASLDDEDDL